MKHTFRCSGLDQAIECPASVTLNSVVDARVGDEGLEGSALHHYSAFKIIQELGGAAPDGLGEADPKWPSLRFSHWVSDYYVRHVRDNTPADWSLEVEAALAYELEHFILSGHIDCCAISPDAIEAIGWDLKTGYDPVDEAEQNWQMLGYIVLLKLAYPTLRKVTFYVIQPRNDEDEGFQRVSHVTVTDLDAAVATIDARLLTTLKNPNELNTGRKQCKWCPAAMQCPAIREIMKMLLTPEMLAKVKNAPDNATLADWVLASKLLSKPAEDAEKMAKDRIAAGTDLVATDGTVIGIKVQRGSYRVTNPQGLWDVLREILPENRRAVCAKWSVSAVKDQIAEELNVPATGKAPVTAESVFDARCRLHVEQGERKIFTYR